MKEDIYLIQTDTTVGLCSKSFKKLNEVKNRDLNQPCLLTLPNFSSLTSLTRVPKNYRKLVRRSKKTTFIYRKNAYRVVNEDCNYRDLLQRVGGLYSTSANITGKFFQEEWAREVSDILIENSAGFREDIPSKIYKLSKRKIKRVR